MTRRGSGTAAKTERLLNLTIALLATRRGLRKSQVRLAVPQYAECDGDGAFDRMFERDKDELRAIGVPLLTTQTDPWGDVEDAYRIDAEAYALGDVNLTPAQLAVFGLASRMWDQAAMSAASTRALLKLQALGVEPDPDAVMGISPRVRAAEPGFDPLYRATRERYPVSFGYRAAASDGVATRMVEPWTLALRRGIWYLACFDRDRQAPRVFRLSRMSGPWRRIGPPGSVAVPSTDRVTHALASLDRPWGHPGPEQGVAQLWLRPGVAARLRLRAKAAAAPREDSQTGYEALDVAYTDVEWMASQVAAYGGDVVVAGPPPLRSAVLRRWHVAAERHRGDPARPVASGGGANPAAAAAHPRAPAITAVDRLSRLLAMVPYLLDRPGIPIEDAAAHFGVSEEQLVTDLQLLFVCGTPGHLPDDLIEASWSGGVVTVGNADAIARPLRLSGEEAVALLVGLEILAGIPGPHDRDAVLGARRAIAAMLAGHERATPVTFLGDDRPDVTPTVVTALKQGRRLRLRYLSSARDRLSERDVDPWRLLHADGWDYLEAWCHQAGERRTFRLDRIIAVDLLQQAVTTVAPVDPPDGLGLPTATDIEVTVRLGPESVWIADYFHGRLVATAPDESEVVAVLGIAFPGRIERLALGGDGSVEVLAPAQLRAAVSRRATAAIAVH